MKQRFAVLASLSLALTVAITHPISLGVAVAQDTPQTQNQQDSDRENYSQYMKVGYAATEQGDYQTALINFQRALKSRPNDRYARAAIRNVQTYINRQRQQEARQRQIEAQIAARDKLAQELSQRLQQATTNQDWRCAVETIDRLIPLVPADSLKRAELVTYRSRLQGLITSEANINRWSTVCSA